MAAGLNKRRAAALLDQATLLLQRGDAERAAEVLLPVVEARVLPGPDAPSLYAEALERSGRTADARTFLEAEVARAGERPMLAARLGALLIRENEAERGVELLSRVQAEFRRDPSFQTSFAAGLARAGRLAEAESAIATAMLTGGKEDTRLVLALIKAQRGDVPGAEAIAVQVGTQTKSDDFRAAARAIEADCRLMQGDARGANERFRALDAEGRLPSTNLPHAALAAQLSGDEALATLYMQRRRDRAAAEDHLLFAKVYLARNRPTDALAELELAHASTSERLPGHDYELSVAKARALRLLGRSPEAKALLDEARALPEAELRPLGARVWLEVGHVAAETGDFELADVSFARALELDPNDAEAALARQSSSRKVAWKVELKASAEARVEAVKAEAEAMKRRFLAREGELEAMRRELSRLKSQSRELEETAAQHASDAARLKAEQAQRVREEIEARERDADEKAHEALEHALGDSLTKCPEALTRLVLVAERTYQKSLYSEIPAAAVAVLFSGALEKALGLVFTQRFERHLATTKQRAEFLRAATKAKRGKRVEYFDRFVESFDPALEAKAPGLGEICRVLARRREAPLAIFERFVRDELALTESVVDALTRFVLDAKERLRDPIAHGQVIDLDWEQLKAFRGAFLVEFEGGPCVLARLVQVA